MEAKANEQDDGREKGDEGEKDKDEQDNAGKQRKKPHLEFRDDYREETIKTYTEWLRQRRQLPDILQYTKKDTDGVHTDSEDKNHESDPSTREWPSHARHPKKKGKDNLLHLQFKFYVHVYHAKGV